MNITPTSLHVANCMATKLAVYHDGKNIALFKSIYFATKYLFDGSLLKKSDYAKYHFLINNKCCQQKQPEHDNIFGATFFYRYANDEQKEVLGDNDYLIFDERFKNKSHEAKLKRKVYDYSLEAILEEGDMVEIICGNLKGSVCEIAAISSKNLNTPGKFYYYLETGNGLHSFKATHLELISKNVRAEINLK